MPPKPKLTEKAIVDAAFAHVRRHGWEGLTARYLAEKLNTSTKPIYFHFPSMAAIEERVVERAMAMILDYMNVSRTGDLWIDQAVGVVMFAVEEKRLFRAIFDEKQVEVRKKYSVDVWRAGKSALVDYPLFKDLSEAQVEAVRRVRWVFVHGLASLMSITNWTYQKENETLLHTMIQRVSRAVYQEFKDDPYMLLTRDYFPEASPDKDP